jgi:hypothetical protein
VQHSVFLFTSSNIIIGVIKFVNCLNIRRHLLVPVRRKYPPDLFFTEAVREAGG